MKKRIFFLTITIFTLGLLAPKPVQAQEPTSGPAGPQPAQAEEPTSAVGRVSFTHGDVSTMRGDSGEWVATTVNAPLVPGDKIATGQGSRAEVQLDFANVLRLDQRAEAKIADLTRTRIQIQLASGLADFTVLKGTEADVEIDTPNMAVHVLGEGTYRIQVNSDSDTQVTVRKGEAEVSTSQGSTTVENGQVIYVKGTDNPEYQTAHAAAKDDWDQWNQNRDRDIEEAASYRYTNRYYTGANDLDNNGQWSQVPDYDWCWTPNVDAGWVPYSDGRWVWEPYWGWTWVSYEPWGWAPYHYGRWFYYGNSWRWWPGRGYGGYGYGGYGGYYPSWGPAYVSFLGFGFGGRRWGFGFGYGFDRIGWCPLGPRDGFHRWWGRGNSFSAVNITNVTNNTRLNNFPTHVVRGGQGRVFGSNIEGALANGNIRRGITTVSSRDFSRGNVPRNAHGLDANTLRQASVVNGTLPVVPARESLQSVNRPVNRAALPNGGANTQRFFSNRPAAAGPTSFTQRAAEIQHMVQTHNSLTAGNAAASGAGRVPSSGMNRSTTGAAPAAAGAAGAGRGMTARPPAGGQAPGTRAAAGTGAPGANNQGGWRRFSSQPSPARQATGGRSSAAAAPRSQTASPGWSRFTPRPAGNSPARSGGWNAPAPRGGYARPAPQTGYGAAGRPPLQLRRPIVTERPSGPRSYGGGGYRGYSAPSGGGYRGYSAPSGGGSRGGSAPSGGGSRGGSAHSGGGSHSAPASHGGGRH